MYKSFEFISATDILNECRLSVVAGWKKEAEQKNKNLKNASQSGRKNVVCCDGGGGNETNKK